jgi:tetratricopeptide (TPR) repeat protein
MPQHVDPTEPVYIASYLVVIVATVAAIAIGRRRPGVAFAWILFVLILFPLLGVHQNGPQIAADRYTYDAAPVLTILLAAGWAMLRRPLSSPSMIAAGGLVFVLGALTWQQSEIWHDSVTMWSKVLTLNPQSSVTLTALGNLEAKAGHTDAAIDYYERSLAVAPDSPEAENNLGTALSHDKRFAEALVHFQRAVRLKTGYYEAENNWGLALAELQGNLDEAIAHYRRALAMNPDYADAHVNWGNALVLRGEFDEAISHYRTALRIRPDDADAYRNWGVALARQTKFGESIEMFRRALALRPDFADAAQLLDRATALQKQRQSGGRPH